MNPLEAWIRNNFTLKGPWNPDRPELTFDICRAIWHCLQGRFVNVEMREGTKTWTEDISCGAVFNSETLARLLAEKEGAVFLDQNTVVKELIEGDNRFTLLRIPVDKKEWYVRAKDVRPTKENPQPIEPNPALADKWGAGPKAIVLGHNPWEPGVTMYNPALDHGVIREYEKQERAVIEEAQKIIEQQTKAGAKYETNTFVNCAPPPGPATQAVINVIRRTAKGWGENIKDLEGPFPMTDKK